MRDAHDTPEETDSGFGIYVHWPFCAQKCPYCDFNSHVRFQGWDEARFLSAYKKELDTFAEHVPRQQVASIFFGGGTPSLMQGQTVAAILDHIATLWPVSDNVEVTLEANPGSVESGRFLDYKAAGVNRVSIGVQSLIDKELKALGRVHSVAEARSAIALADQVFDRFSFDLIYARPEQTMTDWRTELRDALMIAGGHLSLYQLTIEDGTPFAERFRKGQLIVPDDELARDLFDLTQDMTQAAGFSAYEVSNHARAGEESRHNLIYWTYGDYVGVGPGAHGRVMWDGQRQSTVTLKHPGAWCDAVGRDGHGFEKIDTLTKDDQADEFLMMGLRLKSGIDVQRYTKICGRALSLDTITELESDGFVEWVGQGAALEHESDQDIGGDGALFGGELKACIAPGTTPSRLKRDAVLNRATKDLFPVRDRRLRVTSRGRFVLNQIVYQLATHTEPM